MFYETFAAEASPLILYYENYEKESNDKKPVAVKLVSVTGNRLKCLQSDPSKIYNQAPGKSADVIKRLGVFTNMRYTQGSVQFPLDQPMPLELISKIVQFRVKKNLEKAEKTNR